MTAQLQSALVAGDRFVIRFSVQIALALNVFIQVPNQEIGDGAFVPVHDKVSGGAVFFILHGRIILYKCLIDFRNFALGKLRARFGIVYEGAAVIIQYIYFLSIDSVFLLFQRFKLFYTF